jgi:hypothetical protein
MRWVGRRQNEEGGVGGVGMSDRGDRFGGW